MKVICAWCPKHISGDPDDPGISHGSCEPCAKALLAEAGLDKEESDDDK